MSVREVAGPPEVLTLEQSFTTTTTINLSPLELMTVTTTYTTTITTSCAHSRLGCRRSPKRIYRAVFSLLDGGATALFASDEEIFALSSLGVITDGRTETVDATVNLRSMPRIRVATPSPLDIALTQGRVGATVLAPGAAAIAIWHNFGASETVLDYAAGFLFRRGRDDGLGDHCGRNCRRTPPYEIYAGIDGRNI